MYFFKPVNLTEKVVLDSSGDLLASVTSEKIIYEDPENHGSVCMKGLKEATLDANGGWLNIGNLERQTAATNLKRQSSRFHTLFTLLVGDISVDGEELNKSGKLHLADLAGSENIGRSGARKAGTINKTLLTLEKVITYHTGTMFHIDADSTRQLRTED